MYIYCIGTGTKQKIGFTSNIEQRLKTLQTANSEQLNVHETLEVEDRYIRKFEQYIHHDQSHRRLKGEWFNMTAKEGVDLINYYQIMYDTIISTL